ncbi:hypothetical protein H5T87_09840 [bacterium]|nr:hypothetical protein [bacterium]
MKKQKKRKYEAPRLTVVPLRAEERLLSCGKIRGQAPLCELSPDVS